LPILLLLAVGALEFGRVYFTKIVLTNSAREGAYFLSFNNSDSSNCSGTGPGKICFLDTREAIKKEANNSGVNLSDSDIIITTPCCTDGQPVIVNVQTTVDHLLLISLLSNGTSIHLTNNSILLSATTQMVAQ
jgi:Flp pilus assembly protein TadG